MLIRREMAKHRRNEAADNVLEGVGVCSGEDCVGKIFWVLVHVANEKSGILGHLGSAHERGEVLRIEDKAGKTR